MLYVITYDVSTTTPAGCRRLRHVARECENYGVRVQNSVFECELSYDSFQTLKHKLSLLINSSTDSLRFYPVGKKGRDNVIHIGAKEALDVTSTLIL